MQVWEAICLEDGTVSPPTRKGLDMRLIRNHVKCPAPPYFRAMMTLAKSGLSTGKDLGEHPATESHPISPGQKTPITLR